MLTGNGSNLSQGQAQLLSIARAAVADPPAMILDEATSSIDTRTEAHVQQGMDNLMEGRTVFVIAHRLSTVRNSDAIMVLEQGRIIERGSHDDLIAQKGVYYQLYTGAFELVVASPTWPRPRSSSDEVGASSCVRCVRMGLIGGVPRPCAQARGGVGIRKRAAPKGDPLHVKLLFAISQRSRRRDEQAWTCGSRPGSCG